MHISRCYREQCCYVRQGRYLSSKKEFIQLSQRQSKLLLNKEYFSIFNRIKEYNLSSLNNRPNSDVSIKKDILKLKEIEVKEFGDSFLWNLVYATE